MLSSYTLMNKLWGNFVMDYSALCVPVTLEVLYPQKTITVARGSSVKLSCDANYDSEQCGLVRVVWLQKDTELSDPDKYFTTVNETVSDGNMRRRQVVVEIVDLTTEDTGVYQCKGECENGETAMGHIIRISVKGTIFTADADTDFFFIILSQ
uniref:Ig-like domain-containing protein n=1 Tax=Scophthalmus maximus TaxID=52904 RepID=A0A8D3B1K0_SCOMX